MVGVKCICIAQYHLQRLQGLYRLVTQPKLFETMRKTPQKLRLHGKNGRKPVENLTWHSVGTNLVNPNALLKSCWKDIEDTLTSSSKPTGAVRHAAMTETRSYEERASPHTAQHYRFFRGLKGHDLMGPYDSCLLIYSECGGFHATDSTRHGNYSNSISVGVPSPPLGNHVSLDLWKKEKKLSQKCRGVQMLIRGQNAKFIICLALVLPMNTERKGIINHCISH